MNCLTPLCSTSLTHSLRLSITGVEYPLEEHHA